MNASRVFVSHASSDDAVVRRLREALTPHGVDLWIDRRELAPGDALDPEIDAAIDGAAHVIAILGPEALKSAWVKKEVEQAKEVRSRRPGFRLVPVLRPPFEPEMTSWILGEDVVAIRLGDDPGAFDRAVAEILVALDLDLREDLPEGGPSLEPRPLDDLVLELSEPEIREQEGTRRAAARARLLFRPADPGKRTVESKPFRFVAPLGPIEAEDLTWYLERYATWPSEFFAERHVFNPFRVGIREPPHPGWRFAYPGLWYATPPGLAIHHPGVAAGTRRLTNLATSAVAVTPRTSSRVGNPERVRYRSPG